MKRCIKSDNALAPQPSFLKIMTSRCACSVIIFKKALRFLRVALCRSDNFLYQFCVLYTSGAINKKSNAAVYHVWHDQRCQALEIENLETVSFVVPFPQLNSETRRFSPYLWDSRIIQKSWSVQDGTEMVWKWHTHTHTHKRKTHRKRPPKFSLRPSSPKLRSVLFTLNAIMYVKMHSVRLKITVIFHSLQISLHIQTLLDYLAVSRIWRRSLLRITSEDKIAFWLLSFSVLQFAILNICSPKLKKRFRFIVWFQGHFLTYFITVNNYLVIT